MSSSQGKKVEMQSVMSRSAGQTTMFQQKPQMKKIPLPIRISNIFASTYSLELCSYLRNTFMLCLLELVIFIQQLVFLEDSSLFRVDLLKQIHSAAKLYFAFTGIIHTHRTLLVWSVFGLLTAKNLLLWKYLLKFHHEGESSSASKTFIKACFVWHKFKFSIAWIPISFLICESVVVQNSGADAIAAFGIVILLGIQSIIMQLLSQEYALPNLRLDNCGNFLAEFSRPALDFFLVLIEVILNRQPDMNPRTRFSILSILLIITRVTILVFMIYGAWYPYTTALPRVVISSQIILTILGSYELCYLAYSATNQLLAVELIAIVAYILLFQVFENLRTARMKHIYSSEYSAKLPVHFAEIKTNHLLGLYTVSQEDYTTNPELLHELVTHMSDCKSPTCLCRLLHTKLKVECFPDFQEKKQLEAYWREKLGISSLVDKLVFLDNKQSVNRTLTDQNILDEKVDDIVTSETLALQLKKLENDKRNVSLLTKSIYKRFSSKARSHKLPLLDSSSPHLKSVLFSFLTSFSLAQQSPAAVFLAFRYCLDQLQNSTLVLLRGYDLLRTRTFSQKAAVADYVRLANLLDKARASFEAGRGESAFWVAGVRFAEVLRDTERIDYCSDLLDRICQTQHGLFGQIQKKAPVESVVSLGNQMFEDSKEFKALTGSLLQKVFGSRKLLMLVINYKLNVSQEVRGIKNLLERYQRFSSKRKASFGLDNVQKSDSLNFFDPHNMVMMHAIKSSGTGVVYYTKNTPKQLSYAPERLEGLNIKELLPGKLKAVHDDYIVDFLNCRKNDTLAPFAISGFMIDGKSNSLMVNNLVKVEVIGTDHIFIASLTTVIPTKKGNGLMILDEDFSVLSLNQHLKTNIVSLERSPGRIFYHVPLLIELARNCLGLPKLQRERSIRNSEIVALKSQEFVDEPKEPKLAGSSTPMIRISPIIGASPVVPNPGSENNLNLRDLLKVDGSSIQNIPSSIRRPEPSSPMLLGSAEHYRSQFRPGSLVSDSNMKINMGSGQQGDLKTLQNDLKLELELKQLQTGQIANSDLQTEFHRASFEAFYLDIDKRGEGPPPTHQKHNNRLQTDSKESRKDKRHKLVRVQVRDAQGEGRGGLDGQGRKDWGRGALQEDGEADLGVNRGDGDQFVEGLLARYANFLECYRGELQSSAQSLKECTVALTCCRYKPELTFYAVEIKNVRSLEHKACRMVSRQLLPNASPAALSSILMVEVGMFKAFCRV